MQRKDIRSRIVLKHDTAANWQTAGENGFCPLANEIIMFDPDDSCAMIRYKIGRWANDEKTELVNINDLPFESNVYVGRDEPLNAPVGFIWVDTSDEVNLISFNIENRTVYPYTTSSYQAEEGMTFREWVNSDFNTLGLVCLQIDHSSGYPALEDDDDHIRGIGLMFYADGTTGDGSDEERGIGEEWLVCNTPDAYPSHTGDTDEGITDCDQPIVSDYTYTMILWP